MIILRDDFYLLLILSKAPSHSKPTAGVARTICYPSTCMLLVGHNWV